MSNATLVLLITMAILAQVAAVGLFGWQRRRARLQQLNLSGGAAGGEVRPALVLSRQLPEAEPALVAAGVSPAAWSGYREFRIERRAVEDECGAVCSFYLVPTDGGTLTPYRPGQYLTFRLEVPDPAGGSPKTLVRCYSLSDRPRADCYRISVKRVPSPPGRSDLPPGVVSNSLHDQLQEGGTLWARAPAGHFYLTDDGAVPIVLIGGGIGITPLLCILSTLTHRADPREVWLFYGVRHGAEHIMKEHLEGLSKAHPNVHLQVCYSEPRPDDRLGTDYQHQGFVNLELLRRTLRFGRHEFYVCGPPAMMESLVPALQVQGVASEDIHYESFGPASLNQRQVPNTVVVTDPVAVRFSGSGKTVAWDGCAGSLLDLAESQGISVDSGCRAGSCGTCETRIEAGEVEYRQQPDADLKPGHCLLCISTPKTDLTLAL
ncbi:MAG: 2Fe-2S iron-sulfur cluster binding domain-containing protein [Lamprocystis purpurea]|jgi:hypothetical protein|uniref:2Fe-2S iron-sulfur cluster-binding protein n=1 Tax=Lamprocystis purpurea TaxID=61598 RepID=UPI00036368F2|nr:2Fe-2S iron-sulfur cluster-binding protein [Lamprocystis purpurea]MBV5274667.1 2Fe-2S iron-sulfur cluster binding domain-containing protein [Lamprocystis purpurea]